MRFAAQFCASVLFAAGCTTIPLGDDPFANDAATPPIGVDGGPGHDAFVAASDAGSTTRAPLDPDYFFCRVQPEVIAAARCASPRGCHASDSGMRLLVAGETDARPTCEGDHPTSAVPASYYTNLARCRAETRATARQSDLYWKPLGHSHPETLFTESSPEAAILRAWIEATP